MSELATLARPYAEAVFKRAKETDTTGQWSGLMSFLSTVMTDKTVIAAVDNPKVSNARITSLIFDICNGQLNQEGENFLKLLIQNGRLKLLPAIAGLFEALKAESEGYIEVEVLTAYDFSKESKREFTSKLEKTLNKKVHMNIKVDKTLIGGILVRAGDRVIDGSIRGQLQQMQKALQ